MSSPTSHIVQSPTLSSVSSSFSMVSRRTESFRLQSDDSDDEIVWSLSEDSSLSEDDNNAAAHASDDDFVILSRPRSPPTPIVTGLSTPVDSGSDGGRQAATPLPKTTRKKRNTRKPKATDVDEALTAKMQDLALEKAEKALAEARKIARKARKKEKRHEPQNKQRRKAKKEEKKERKKAIARAAYPSPVPSPKIELQEHALVKHAAFGFGTRPIVDDLSDRQSVVSFSDNESVVGPSLYEEASTFISRFLSNPDAKHDRVCRLTLLQSLIIELGLATSSLSLPVSLKSAKAVLKSQAFLNIREYVAVRGQGQEAVQKLLYPSKTALINDIRKKRSTRMSIKWVKDHGLQVLLVGWHH